MAHTQLLTRRFGATVVILGGIGLDWDGLLSQTFPFSDAAPSGPSVVDCSGRNGGRAGGLKAPCAVCCQAEVGQVGKRAKARENVCVSMVSKKRKINYNDEGMSMMSG